MGGIYQLLLRTNRNPLLTALFIGVVVITVGSGIVELEVTSDNRVFYSDENERNRQLVEFEEKFTENHNVWLVLHSDTDDEWKISKAIRALQKRAWQLEGAIRVDSVANYNFPVESDTLNSISLLDYLCPERRDCDLKRPTPIDLAPITGRLIDSARKTFSVFVTLELSRSDNGAISKVTSRAHAIARDFQTANPDFEVSVSGGIPMMQAFSEAAERDASSLFPLAFVALLSVCYTLLRSMQNTLCLLALGASTVVTTLGLAGHLGWTFNTASSATGVMVFSIVIASAMHIVVSFRNDLAHYDATTAAEAALKVNLKPILLTTTTTVLSLLSLLFVDSPPLRQLGALSAFGCAFGSALSLGLLPSLLRQSGEIKQSKATSTILVERVFRDTKSTPLLCALGVVAVLGTVGALQTKINDDFIAYFDESYSFKRSTEKIQATLSSPNHLEIEVSSEASAFSQAHLEAVAALQGMLRGEPIVSNSFSLRDVLELAAPIGEKQLSDYSSDGLRQLYFAYELSLQDGQSSTDYVYRDGLSSRVSVLLHHSDSNAIQSLINKLEDFYAPQLESATLTVTGENAPVANLTALNASEMLVGLLVSVSMSALLVGTVFRSFWIGSVCLLATALPIVWGLGIWMLLANEIGLAVLVVISVTIGIVIDDAIHMVSRFAAYRQDAGKCKADAVASTVKTVGSAIVTTTLALGAGTSVLSLSTFGITFALGVCITLILIVSLLVDLVAVPIALAR